MEDKGHRAKTAEARGIPSPHHRRICEHDRKKQQCKDCGGSRYPISILIIVSVNIEEKRLSAKTVEEAGIPSLN
jgi:hypothetical protein